MNRRDFLKAGGAATTVGALIPGISGSAAEIAAVKATKAASPAIVATYSAEDHRRRLKNVAICNRQIRASMRKHLITDYLPGQCCYNLGEYPCRKPWDPDDVDERELDTLRDQGVRLIQVHEEWNDSQRLFGANKFDALNPAGFRRFVDMVHRRGMKIIVYLSSGFFQRTDPDFRREWAREQDLIAAYYQYAWCSPASPGWRAYLLPHLARVLDEYGVDGIYNDLGYRSLAAPPATPTSDEVLAFEETATHDGALADLLELIYAEVHRRGGVVKIHHSGANRPQTDAKIYDYLWVGEYVDSSDGLREAVKNFPPYLVPCLDMTRAKIDKEDDLYLQTIPYMQFPLLQAGRPFTGERGSIPGVKYADDVYVRYLREAWEHYQAHPEGPHCYGWWDSTRGRPEARPTYARWLKQYAPMVEEGTWAWLAIKDSGLFAQPLPENVVASAFANRDLYLVLANYGRAPVEVVTSDAYVPVSDPGAGRQTRWNLEGRSLHILKR